MNVNDALVIDVLILGRYGVSLRRDLLNCSLKFTKALAPVSKWNLRNNYQQQNGEEDFAFHNKWSADIRWNADIPVGGSRASLLAFS